MFSVSEDVIIMHYANLNIFKKYIKNIRTMYIVQKYFIK